MTLYGVVPVSKIRYAFGVRMPKLVDRFPISALASPANATGVK